MLMDAVSVNPYIHVFNSLNLAWKMKCNHDFVVTFLCFSIRINLWHCSIITFHSTEPTSLLAITLFFITIIITIDSTVSHEIVSLSIRSLLLDLYINFLSLMGILYLGWCICDPARSFYFTIFPFLTIILPSAGDICALINTAHHHSSRVVSGEREAG